MGNVLLEVHVNPLEFLEVDEPWASLQGQTLRLEHILQYLCNPGEPVVVEQLVQRYRMISAGRPRVFAAPAEKSILERLIWPLRQAKGQFMLGHYLGTISLSGMVSEMAAILVFDVARINFNGQPMTAKMQRALLGSTYEKLGQERRVEVLAALGLIDDAAKQAYDTVRTKRRQYLHLWSADHDSIERDAVECFSAATQVVVNALGLSVGADGSLTLKQEVLDFLARKGHGGEEPSDGPG